MAGLFHLAKRFFGALSDDPPSEADVAWVDDQLLDGERDVWDRMDNPDRRHAVAVARAVVDALADRDMDPEVAVGPGGRRAVIAAALLHDSGKAVSGFGTPARVGATIAWAVLGAGSFGTTTADRWLAADNGGLRNRLAQYRRHPELGADLLREAGSHTLTVDWAEQHHRPEDRWTVPAGIGRVLKDCDDD